MEAKLSTQTDDYWLQAEVKDDILTLSVLIFSNEQVKHKLSRDISLRKDLKDLRALRNPQNLLKILKSQQNYEIKAEEKAIIIKWTILAAECSFHISS